jgi:hypothetical protein
VDEAYLPQEYLPDEVRGAPSYEPFYAPGPFGFERKVAERLAWWRGLREEAEGSPSKADGSPSPAGDAERGAGGTPESAGDAPPPRVRAYAPARVVPPSGAESAADPGPPSPSSDPHQELHR